MDISGLCYADRPRRSRFLTAALRPSADVAALLCTRTPATAAQSTPGFFLDIDRSAPPSRFTRHTAQCPQCRQCAVIARILSTEVYKVNRQDKASSRGGLRLRVRGRCVCGHWM